MNNEKKDPTRFISKDELLARRASAGRTVDWERVESAKRAALLENALHDLRERRGVTQTAVAEHLATSRPNVSRIEGEADVRLSTLVRYAEAVGGQLVVSIAFPDETIGLVGDLPASGLR